MYASCFSAFAASPLIGVLFAALFFVFGQATGDAAEPSESDTAALRSLQEKLKTLDRHWPEGVMTCEVESFFGSRKFTVMWAGQTRRYDFHDEAEDGEQAGETNAHDITIRDRRRHFSFSTRTYTARISPISDHTRISRIYKVVPQEAWTQIHSFKETDDWVRELIGRPSVSWTCERTEDESYLLKLQDEAIDDDGIYVRFAKSGVPLKYGSQGSGDAFLSGSVTWDHSGNAPTPVRCRKLGPSGKGGPADAILLDVRVLDYRHRLDNDGADLDIPPDDLPVGTRLIDERSTPPRISYIGGELGKLEFQLRQSATLLGVD